jgi:DNA-3-methyladenine glycosylase II
MTIEFTLPLPRGFRLEAARAFFASFVPGSGMAAADAGPDRLTLAFRVDRTFAPAVVSLREGGGVLRARLAGGAERDVVARQLGRILGLEGDAAAWAALGKRDPIIGKLQKSYAGFFTATKPSPYDAAAWAVIAPRVSIAQAAKTKLAIARALGDAITLEGVTHHVFPSPAKLVGVRAFPGLTEEKAARLRGVASAALEGRLDVDRLRAKPELEALAELQTLRGVGPWAASHIYYRGAAPMDGLPTVEPRVLHGLASVYGLSAPTAATFARIAEGWRPFRMWVCVLLARHLGRVGGWRAPSLPRERAAAARVLAARTAKVASGSSRVARG